MSMEDAIKEHAAALRELAAAVSKRTDWMAEGMAAIGEIKGVLSGGNATVAAEDKPRGTSKAEAAQKQKDIEAERAAELEQAVQKIEADARAPNAADGAAEAAGTSTGAQSEDDDAIGAGDVALDYNKDVKPVLLSLFKKKGPDALGGLLAKHLPGVAKPKGDMLKPEQLAGVLAEANAILAA